MMDNESRVFLDKLLAVNPGVLSETERGFIKARWDYLTDEQKKPFKETNTVDAPKKDTHTNAKKPVKKHKK